MSVPPGFQTAIAVLKAGRAAFVGGVGIDLPTGRSALLRGDDLTPQFGYIGSRYKETGLLLLGTNPRNSKKMEVRTAADERMMPALIQFASAPSADNFIKAHAAYQAECETWHVWRRHCAEVIGTGKLSLDQVAYSNCLPWRTGSESTFDYALAARAAMLYALPLIAELKPRLVVAMGKRGAEVLRAGGGPLPKVIVWNRAQAATKAVIQERSSAAAKIFEALNVGESNLSGTNQSCLNYSALGFLGIDPLDRRCSTLAL